jgi:hypothetical protein
MPSVIDRVSRPKSLTFTKVTGSVSKSFTALQSASVKKTTEFVEVLDGTAQVPNSYQGQMQGEISVTLGSYSGMAGLAVGDRVSNVVLQREAAADSEGIAAGGTVKRTMSKGIITAIEDSGAENSSRAPGTVTITITMRRHEGDTTDPTLTEWELV